MLLVLDTSVAVSGLPWQGTSKRILQARIDGSVDLAASSSLIDELVRILGYRKFAPRIAASATSITELVQRYVELCRLVTPASIGRVSVDPDDDHVLACALGAQADLVVARDADLLNIKSYHAIPIVDPAEALHLIGLR